MQEEGKGTMDFAAHAIGLLAVMVGAMTCYVLASLGVIASELDAALTMTIASIVGFVLVTIGVALRARRLGRDAVGPLIFGAGLLAVMGGSFIVHALALCQVVSETGATLTLASTTALSTVLIVAGTVRGARRVGRKESERVVMLPLRRVYTRRVEEDRDGQSE